MAADLVAFDLKAVGVGAFLQHGVRRADVAPLACPT